MVHYGLNKIKLAFDAQYTIFLENDGLELIPAGNGFESDCSRPTYPSGLGLSAA